MKEFKTKVRLIINADVLIDSTKTFTQTELEKLFKKNVINSVGCDDHIINISNIQNVKVMGVRDVEVIEKRVG